jgi:hypothetical protein
LDFIGLQSEYGIIPSGGDEMFLRVGDVMVNLDHVSVIAYDPEEDVLMIRFENGSEFIFTEHSRQLYMNIFFELLSSQRALYCREPEGGDEGDTGA